MSLFDALMKHSPMEVEFDFFDEIAEGNFIGYARFDRENTHAMKEALAKAGAETGFEITYSAGRGCVKNILLWQLYAKPL